MVESDAILEINQNLQLIALPDATIAVHLADTVTIIRSPSAEDFEQILAAVDGRRTLSEICELLAEAYHAEDLRDLLGELVGSVFRVRDDGAERKGAIPARRVLILSNDKLGVTVAERLAARSFDVEHRRVEVAIQRAARSSGGSRVIYQSPRPPGEGGRLDHHSVQLRDATELSQLMSEFDRTVCLLASVPYSALFLVADAAVATAVPCLFVTGADSSIVIGPTVVAGNRGCLEASRFSNVDQWTQAHREAIPLLNLGGFPASERVIDLVVLKVLDDVQRSSSDFYWKTDRCSENQVVTEQFSSDEGLNALVSIGATPDLLDADAALALSMNYETHLGEGQRVRSVCILGGGTAGYFTAIALRKRYPDLPVTVIDSSKIPIIGVGEATTPIIRQFLHETCGISPARLFSAVQPTFKLGIRFEWGLPGDHYFYYPFGEGGSKLASMTYEGNSRVSNLQCVLMEAKAGPVIETRNQYTYMHDLAFAYHLNNKPFVHFLHEIADELGVCRVDSAIVDVVLSADGERVDRLVADDGGVFSADMFVDCSGFRSLLLEKLGSTYVSYSASLYTDSAMIGTVPNGKIVKPYTTATTMRHGWCWNIPQLEEDHVGYVFSSGFCDEEEAIQELRELYPSVGDHKMVRFKSGRREHFWKGNVVAIGNSYGFVEPLESTGLHMIILEVHALCDWLNRGTKGACALLNRHFADAWDYLRAFLAIHYRFNKKLNTPFWQECRANADIAGIQDNVNMFSQCAPLESFPYFSMPTANPIFDKIGLDFLMLGQGEPTSLQTPGISQPAWEVRVRCWKALADMALPHGEAVSLLASPRGAEIFQVPEFGGLGQRPDRG